MPRPPNAGRKKGSRNKASLAPLYERIATGAAPDPLNLLIEVMTDPQRDWSLRVRAAGLLAEYAYPKLRAVEVSGPGGTPLGLSAGDLKTAMRRALEEVARERAAALATPSGVVIEGTVEVRQPEPAPLPAAVAVATDDQAEDDEQVFAPAAE